MNSMKKLSAALLAALMLTGACAQAETVTGTATGMGAVSVELTVEDGKITAAAAGRVRRGFRRDDHLYRR